MKTASRVELTPKDILQLVSPEMVKVEEELKEIARFSPSLIHDINLYLHNSGGKRLRPALLLLASRLCDYQGAAAVKLGVVIELMHVATLVHDDIIDNAEVRRGHASVRSRWGNEITVLMGDWLYMTSFQLALDQRNFQVLDLLIDVARKMVEGELMQLKRKGDIAVSIDDHLDICRHKTAALFGACGRLGAILGEADTHLEEQLEIYGTSLGMAFQLIDDLLDYTSDEGVLGKPVLKDLEEGKVTLPIIFLMQRANPSEQEFLREVVDGKNFSAENKQEIIRLVGSHGALEELHDLAGQYAGRAGRSMEHFPESIYRQALLALPDMVLCRDR
ncbi:MAG: polyprenyl synthetase family protein [Acidobacteriota bacterium]